MRCEAAGCTDVAVLSCRPDCIDPKRFCKAHAGIVNIEHLEPICEWEVR